MILLFGKNGQLGSELHEEFDRLNMPVCGIGREEADLSHPESILQILDNHHPTIIVNAAAYTKVDQAEEESDRAFAINATAPSIMAQWAKQHNAYFIHFSTDFVFAGTAQDRQTYPNGYPVDALAHPMGAYGRSKWEGEKAIRASGAEAAVIRVAWLCGKNGSNFIKTMLRLVETRNELSVVDDQWGAPSFVDKVVECTLALIEHPQSGTFHCASEGITSWARFAEKAFEFSGKECTVHRIASHEYPTKAERPKFSKLELSSLQSVPGFQTEAWEDGLQRLLSTLQ